MNRNKGFTLIELLAVVVLLGIVAVISVPVVKDITKNAKQKGFEKQVDTILQSTKSWAIKNTDLLPEGNASILVKIDTLQKEGLLENKTIKNPINNSEMNGCAKISHNQNYNQYEYEYVDNCSSVKGKLETISTTSTTLDVTSVDSCVKDGTKCENGTAFAIKVNNSTIEKFYVISDNGHNVTLIMNRDLVEDAAWYKDLNDTTTCNSSWCYHSKGPLTALAALESATAGWTNIDSYSYTLNDDNVIPLYNQIERVNVRARMLSYTEAVTLGCQSFSTNNTASGCPDWLNGDIGSSGYWLSTASPHSEISAYLISIFQSIGQNNVLIDNHYGVRPVITVPKIVTY